MIPFTFDAILFLIFVAFVAIYEMLLRGVLTMEILLAIFSGNGITYIFLAGAFLFFEVVLDPEAVGDDDIGLGILDGCLLFGMLDDVVPTLATLGRCVPRNNKHFRGISFIFSYT